MMSTLHQSPLTRIAVTLKRAHGGIVYTDFKEENSGAVNEGAGRYVRAPDKLTSLSVRGRYDGRYLN